MNRRNFLKNLGSATYEATKAQVPTTPKIIQKVREIDDFATKAKKYDNFAENINSGLEKSVSRRQFLKKAAKPAARAAISALESGAKGAAYLSEGSLIPNPQTMQPISSLADKFREAVRYIKFQKGKDMKHFADFGIGSTVGLSLAGGLLGNAIGNSIGRKPEIDNQYKTLNDNYYARQREIYPQVESLDEPDPTEEELVRRRSAHDELTKDYLSKVAPLNEKYKDYKQGVDNRSNLGLAVGTGLGLLAANRKTLANPVKAYKSWQWQQNRKNSMPIR
jgi:hypothetical protein